MLIKGIIYLKLTILSSFMLFQSCTEKKIGDDETISPKLLVNILK